MPAWDKLAILCPLFSSMLQTQVSCQICLRTCRLSPTSTFTYIKGLPHVDLDAIIPAQSSVQIYVLTLYWKLPIAFFLVSGTRSGLLAGVIRDSLFQAFEVGLDIFTVTMDGMQHSAGAYLCLGANLQPSSWSKLFPHPHPDAKFDVFAFPDPPYMLKLIRSTLGDYSLFVWEGKGVVKWEHIKKLHEGHGLTWATN